MFAISAITILALASFGSVAGDSILIESHAEGSAPGLGPAARNEAIRNAQAKMVIDRLEALAPVRDFSLFAPLIENPERFLPSYRVVDERTSDDATHVEIAGQLLDVLLKREAAALVLSSYADKPRAILIVSERVAPGVPRLLSEEGVAEGAIKERLCDAKFDVIDSRQLLAEHSEADLLQCLGGSPDLACQLARRHLADIAILGSAVSFIEDGTTLRRHRAEIELRVIRAADGYLLEDIDSVAELTSADARQGGIVSVNDACEKVAFAIMNAAALGMLGGAPQNQVYLTVEGLGHGVQLDQILQTIKTLPGVDSVEEMYASDEIVRMAVNYAGPMGPFVDALSSRKYDGYSLHTKSVVNRDMTVRVRQ
jgi:hypothetical protein